MIRQLVYTKMTAFAEGRPFQVNRLHCLFDGGLFVVKERRFPCPNTSTSKRRSCRSHVLRTVARSTEKEAAVRSEYSHSLRAIPGQLAAIGWTVNHHGHGLIVSSLLTLLGWTHLLMIIQSKRLAILSRSLDGGASKLGGRGIERGLHSPSCFARLHSSKESVAPFF